MEDQKGGAIMAIYLQTFLYSGPYMEFIGWSCGVVSFVIGDFIFIMLLNFDFPSLVVQRNLIIGIIHGHL